MEKLSIVGMRIHIIPEYGKPWDGVVLRTYDNDTVAIVLPDDTHEAWKVDLESTKWELVVK
jgi:hypothetical protein